MTARPGQQLVWDNLGRLTTVKTTGGTTIASYTYDALDRLRQVTRSGNREERHSSRWRGRSSSRGAKR